MWQYSILLAEGNKDRLSVKAAGRKQTPTYFVQPNWVQILSDCVLDVLQKICIVQKIVWFAIIMFIKIAHTFYKKKQRYPLEFYHAFTLKLTVFLPDSCTCQSGQSLFGTERLIPHLNRLAFGWPGSPVGRSIAAIQSYSIFLNPPTTTTNKKQADLMGN